MRGKDKAKGRRGEEHEGSGHSTRPHNAHMSGPSRRPASSMDELAKPPAAAAAAPGVTSPSSTSAASASSSPETPLFQPPLPAYSSSSPRPSPACGTADHPAAGIPHSSMVPRGASAAGAATPCQPRPAITRRRWKRCRRGACGSGGARKAGTRRRVAAWRAARQKSSRSEGASDGDDGSSAASIVVLRRA